MLIKLLAVPAILKSAQVRQTFQVIEWCIICFTEILLKTLKLWSFNILIIWKLNKVPLYCIIIYLRSYLNNVLFIDCFAKLNLFNLKLVSLIARYVWLYTWHVFGMTRRYQPRVSIGVHQDLLQIIYPAKIIFWSWPKLPHDRSYPQLTIYLAWLEVIWFFKLIQYCARIVTISHHDH